MPPTKKFEKLTELKVPPFSSLEQVADHQSALKWHPDKVDASQREKAEEVFKDIKQAYEILSDGIYVEF